MHCFALLLISLVALDIVGGFEETVMRSPTTAKIDKENIAIVLANRERIFHKN